MKKNVLSFVLVLFVCTFSLMAETLPKKTGKDVFAGNTFKVNETESSYGCYAFGKDSTLTTYYVYDGNPGSKTVYNYSVDGKNNRLYLQIKGMTYENSTTGLKVENLNAEQYAKLYVSNINLTQPTEYEYEKFSKLNPFATDKELSNIYFDYQKVQYGIPRNATLEESQQYMLTKEKAYYKKFYEEVQVFTYKISDDGKTIELLPYFDSAVTLPKMFHESYMPTIGNWGYGSMLMKWGAMRIQLDYDYLYFVVNEIDDDYITATIATYDLYSWDDDDYIINPDFGKKVKIPYTFLVTPVSEYPGLNRLSVVFNYKGMPVTIQYPAKDDESSIIYVLEKY